MQDGETPLHGAAREGHQEVVRCLVENGAYKDALDKVGTRRS